jgi:hypothetical protein
LTETETTIKNPEREALRRRLAEQASGHEKAQGAVKALQIRLREREEEEKRRRVQFAEETKIVMREKGAAVARAQGAGQALERLRQEFVPLEVRHALSAAKRELDQAKLRLKHALSDLGGASTSLAELRERVKKVPSAAAAADLMKAVKAAEDAIAPLEARADEARGGVEHSEATLRQAERVFDAAMAAARAL